MSNNNWKVPVNATKRRVMRLMVTPDIIIDIAKTNKPVCLQCVKNALPEDAVSVGVTHDFYTNTFCIFVESAAFEEVEPGSIPPELPPCVFETRTVNLATEAFQW